MTHSIEILFEKHISLINSTIRRNRPLLAALRLESEDVAQDLSIAMLSAIERFDPERSESLAAHIACSLQYEILNMKRHHKPHGITGIPNGERINFLYMDDELPNSGMCEIPSYSDTSTFEVAELFDDLTEPENKVIDLKANSFYLRRKAQTAMLDGVRCKYNALYENERRVAA